MITTGCDPSAQVGPAGCRPGDDSQFTYDWERKEWTNLPLGFQIGWVQTIFKQPFRFYVNPQWNIEDIAGTVKTRVIFGVTLLAPGG